MDNEKVLRGHKDSVRSGSFLNNDSQILTASYDSRLILWDVNSCDILKEYDGHSNAINQAHVSSDDERIVSVGWDCKVLYWDCQTGDIIWDDEYDDIVMCCNFSNDNKKVVTGSDSTNTVRIYECHNGALIHEIKGIHSNTITSCLFTASDDKIITTSMDKSVQIWDCVAQKVLLNLRGHNSVVSDASYSKNNHNLVTVSWDRTIAFWDLGAGLFRSQGPTKINRVHEGSISSCAFFDNGLRLATGSYDNFIGIWDVSTLRLKKRLTGGHSDWIEGVSISKDENTLLSVSKDTTARLWSLKDLHDKNYKKSELQKYL